MTLLRGVAAEAAEQAYTAWQAHPAGAALLDPALAHASRPTWPERAERLVRDWQRGVLELVREEGGDKRVRGPRGGVRGERTGLAVMIAVFTSTAFIPTGLEVAVGAGTTVAAQKVLEAIFGDQAVRNLADAGPGGPARPGRRAARGGGRPVPDRTAAARPAPTPAPRCAGAAAEVEMARHRSGLPAADGPALPPTAVGRPDDATSSDRVREALRGRRSGSTRTRWSSGWRPAPVPARWSTATCRTTGWSPPAPSSSGPANGSRCPATTPWSRWPAPPAAASPACSTRSPGCELSPVGVRRPTTGVAHACVWGPLGGASRLLDWLGVLPRHRFVRESALDGDDEAALHGLVLLDLPDFDSVERSHRLEVDRLLGLVDLVVWVLDPQKYARPGDARPATCAQFHRHRDVTVVVLNQADRLPPAELPGSWTTCAGCSTPTGWAACRCWPPRRRSGPGWTGLRRRWSDGRRAAGGAAAAGRRRGRRGGRAGTAGRGRTGGHRARATRSARRAHRALAGAAGVPSVAEAAEGAYRHRAGGDDRLAAGQGVAQAAAGPAAPVAPAGRGNSDAPAESLVAATSVPDPTAAQRSALDLAIRAVGDRSSGDLPAPWPTAVTAAARSRLGDLPDALDRAVAATDLGMDRRPAWWRVVGALQWLVTLAALAGLGWLVLGYGLRALGLPAVEYPRVGEAPLPTVLLLGGLLAGLLVAALTRPVVRWAARRARQRAEQRLTISVGTVGEEYVLVPVRAVLGRYAQAREALGEAARR